MRRSARRTTDYFHRLDICTLRKRGYLRAGSWFTVRWIRGGEERGAIQGYASEHSVVLTYRHGTHSSGYWKDQEYPICLDRTPCNYGGERVWFLCPAPGCGRRVSVLYGGGIFACRHCHHLAYESQRETPYDRALRRSQAVRIKLGGSGSLTEDFPLKPKGMHSLTYWRYVREAEGAYSRSISPWLNDILSRRRKKILHSAPKAGE